MGGIAKSMKRFLLISSLLLNGLLAAALWMKPPAPSASPKIKAPRTKVLTRTVVQEVEAPAVTNTVPAAPIETFHWSSIQSTNFVEYAEKLKELGCPPQTIRDIITGEINDWILAQRRALYEPFASRFWELTMRSGPGIPEELREPVKALKKMRGDLLAAALDKIPKTEGTKKSRPDGTLGMLPEEKREQLQKIEKKYSDLRKEIQRDKKIKSDEKSNRLVELQKKEDAEREAVFSPEELAEFKIRQQSYQFQNLYGFKTDEEEMRKIATVRAKNFSTENNSDSPADREIRETRAKQRDEELKALLGEKRFAEFERGSDPRYRDALKVAQAYKLPEETAVRAFEINEELNKQARAVRKNPALTPEQIKATIQELQDATGDALAELYGEKAFRTLQRTRAY